MVPVRFSDAPAEATWRREVREFVERECPDDLRERGLVLMDRELGNPGHQTPEQAAHMTEWRGKLLDRGWIAPAWPKEYGGAGMTPMQQFIFNMEFAEARVPQVGVPLVGPTLILHGSAEQKARFLPELLKGQQRWCQGFSEPGAGSDLASLQTRAERDGDDFVINGQKIWTTGAHVADWIFMLARTDPDAPKHRGISYLLVDMKSPGIDVQPLASVAPHGFNQVFFNDVRVPAENVVGEVNRGWYVATTTLDFERSGVGSAVGTRQSVEGLVQWAKENVASGQSMLGRNPEVRTELADRLVEAYVAQMLAFRIADLQNRGIVPNYEASVGKLYASELNQRIGRTALKLAGMYGNVYQAGSPYAPVGGRFVNNYLSNIYQTIAAGTSEIQRNIIAQRGLGLPRI